MALPPLLSERPTSHQRAIIIAGPIIGGALTGLALGVSEGVWLVANIIMILGGVVAGFDHLGAGAGARRGLFGGFVFGLALLATHEITGMEAEAKLPDPGILLVVVTTAAGCALGALGGALRARAQARAAEPAVETEPVL
jgi:hypothetical protein